MLESVGAGCKLYYRSCYWSTAFDTLFVCPPLICKELLDCQRVMRPPSRTKPIKGAKKKLPPERGKVPVAAAIAASPPVIDIAETDDGSDSEDESSRPPSTSSSSRFSQKRKQPGGQKKAFAYYTEDAETGTSTCKSCNHEAKPAGNTGNAVSHLKNRHPDAFAKYEEQEKLRKDLKKKKQDKPATGIAMIQSKLKFESSNPFEQRSLRHLD
ncbi:LOW QUALITY PROTEIN: hypothetical protein RvY_02178 [Ramazzottius varieornatus]|uniref:BED-type domain-containing protein n=1 Tax=Ramazzottius varieornatus TaxID=947166 RepID=A0A1D1UM79_RAMVA|nr:LOW QUALITY PROTEIN: hypothetical protein RvY_02178 [Ramazzottius varieornatus]